MPLVMNDESETLVRVLAETGEDGSKSYRIMLVFPDGTSQQSLPLGSLTMATTVAGILNELGLGSKTSPSGSTYVPMYDLLSLLVPGDVASDQLQDLMTAATTASAEHPGQSPESWIDLAVSEQREGWGAAGSTCLADCMEAYPDAFAAAARECAEAARRQAAQTQTRG